MITILQPPKRKQESLGYKSNQFILTLAVLEERESSIQNFFFPLNLQKPLNVML